MENYSKGSHTIYHHRYHLVWIIKYRYKVLSGKIQIRTREILGRISEELGLKYRPSEDGRYFNLSFSVFEKKFFSLLTEEHANSPRLITDILINVFINSVCKQTKL
ncbi:MAG: hypothetical protein GY830_08080 [Bacteroidetes bacterium]|nr:hypothetical protein [Bacteroidota bacterium]